MKAIRSVLMLIAITCTITTFGQDAIFSPNTKALLLQVQNLSSLKSTTAEVSASLKQFYPVRTIDNQNYIGALVKVSQEIDEEAMADLGIKINTRINSIWSVVIPLPSLERLKDVKGLVYVEADGVIKKKLDNATTESNVKKVQDGTGLKRSCLGDSVVIAGGSGYLTPGLQYMGVAPASDLVFVSMGEAASAITDGINYIFQYAASVGRPAVVNLSLGSHIDPHDGTSLMDQTIDGLVGQGKIVAGAAGNEGDTPLHLYHAFSNDTIRTFMDFEANTSSFNTGQIDQWGSASSDFSMSISISDQQGQVLASTPFYNASTNPAIDQVVMIGSDSLHYKVTGVGSSPLNQKPDLLATIERLNKKYRVTLILTSSNSYTGKIGPDGSNTWGWGKIDAQKSVLAAFNVLGIEGQNGSGIVVYPNPSTGMIFLKNAGTKGQTSEISVQNMIGTTVLKQSHTWSEDEVLGLDLAGSPNGMYVITIVNEHKKQTHVKTLISK